MRVYDEGKSFIIQIIHTWRIQHCHIGIKCARGDSQSEPWMKSSLAADVVVIDVNRSDRQRRRHRPYLHGDRFCLLHQGGIGRTP